MLIFTNFIQFVSLLQRRVHDVDAAQDRRPKAGTDQTACQGRTRPSCYQAGFLGGPRQVQQICVQG